MNKYMSHEIHVHVYMCKYMKVYTHAHMLATLYCVQHAAKASCREGFLSANVYACVKHTHKRTGACMHRST